VIQLTALLLGAARVPLWAHFPKPGEQFGAHEMLVAQIVASGMLFPYLLRDWRARLVIIATALPFLELAGFLSGLPFARVTLAWVYLGFWILSLGFWRSAQPIRSASIGVAIANALSLGGALLWYLRAEFADERAVTPWPADGRLGPIMGGLQQLRSDSPSIATWLPMICLVIISILAARIWRREKMH
jgi:hypothetical protein